MLGKASLAILEKAISALHEDLSGSSSKVIAVSKKIVSYPVKVIATFLFAPFLILRVAYTVNNPIRRIMAIVGILISFSLAYASGTLLGSLTGTLLIISHVSILVGLGFFIGTTLSVLLSVIFSIIIFNSVSYLFLKMSSQEVVDYLKEIST